MPILERALFAVGGILLFGGLVAVDSHERSLTTAAHERATTMMLMKLVAIRPAEPAAALDECVAAADSLLSPMLVEQWPVLETSEPCARVAHN